MTAPKFDSTIQLGSVLTIISMVALMALSWGVHTTTLTNLDARLSRLDVVADAHEHRIRHQELLQAAESQKLNAIIEGIREIKEQLNQRPRTSTP